MAAIEYRQKLPTKMPGKAPDGKGIPAVAKGTRSRNLSELVTENTL